MMDTIAQRLLESVSWGLKMRLYTGASLSTLDMVSDLYMIYRYTVSGQKGTALSLGIMVALNLLGQLFLVAVQTKKASGKLLLKEMLIVLSGLAPGIHAVRVAKGGDTSEAIDDEFALTGTRCFEMVFEAVPGSVLQISALLQDFRDTGIYSRVALGSISMSALTTGFAAATISFDYDVNPARRRDEPNFYGYIPDAASRRTLAFGCMIMNSALLLLLRSVSTALLLMVGKWTWVLAYYAGDMAVYFAYRALRNDLWHWYVASEASAKRVSGSGVPTTDVNKGWEERASSYNRRPTSTKGGRSGRAHTTSSSCASVAGGPKTHPSHTGCHWRGR
jgi:hypothetical protein